MKKNLIAAVITAFVVSLILACIFVFPVFQGKELKQFDQLQFKGAAAEIMDWHDKGEDILWTNALFGGMPAYLIHVYYKTNLSTEIYQALISFLPQPAPKIFLLCFCFFLMLLCMRVKPWLAIGGAVAFCLSSYFIIIIAAGHNTKTSAIAFLPLVFGGLYYAYRYNRLVGTAIYILALGLEITSNHIQMTYYFTFFAVAFVVSELIYSLTANKIKDFAVTSTLIIIGTVLAVGMNYSKLAATNEYGKSSTRSKSELTLDAGNQTTGLDRDYITGWSMGISETVSLLIPDFKGGESAPIGANHKDALKDVDPQMRQMVAQSNAYWGDQPSVGGPVYVGAFIFILFIFSLFYVKDRLKWAVIAASVIVLFMSWGRNFPLFTNFMIDYFPLYSKFRAVSSALVVVNLTIPLMATYGLSQMVSDGRIHEKVDFFGVKFSFTWLNLFLYISGIFVLYILTIFIAPTVTSLFTTGEVDSIRNQLLTSGASESITGSFLASLEQARASILRSDALRSLAVVILGIGLVWSYFRFKYNGYILAAGFFVLTLGDLYNVDRRYLNSNNFVSKKTQTNTWPKTASDQYILSDPDIYYRTVNLSVNTFNDATTSFHHHSIGGYHGAKLKIYQELVQYVLSGELQNIQSALQQNPTVAGFEAATKKAPALNMLNTKYFIFGPDGPGSVLKNSSALGNAWFPEEIIPVNTADEEITRLKDIDPKKSVLVRNTYADVFSGLRPDPDSLSSVKLTQYNPDKLTYEVNALQDKIMVVSEIWYPDWKAYINNVEVPVARVNYVLRAIKVPTGKHIVEMRFEPDFHKNENVSLIFSILTVITVIGLLSFPTIRTRFLKKT
jgi:hypothetical protein